MKIRIQDNSIRFRLTLREVEDFAQTGCIERRTLVPGSAGQGGEFAYSIQHAPGTATSAVLLGEHAISFRLSDADRERLLQPDEEGAYLRQEWTSPDGTTQRFMAFVEKDRPGSTCIKPEAWIYDAPPHGELQTRPIPARHPNR